MEVKAQAKYLRAAPRKVRQVADLIRGKNVKEAKVILSFLPNKGAKLIEKVLIAAIANAKHNYKLGEDRLVVSRILIDGTTPFKRIHPRAKGSAFPILHRQSHITIYVEEATRGSKSPS